MFEVILCAFWGFSALQLGQAAETPEFLRAPLPRVGRQLASNSSASTTSGPTAAPSASLSSSLESDSSAIQSTFLSSTYSETVSSSVLASNTSVSSELDSSSVPVSNTSTIALQGSLYSAVPSNTTSPYAPTSSVSEIVIITLTFANSTNSANSTLPLNTSSIIPETHSVKHEEFRPFALANTTSGFNTSSMAPNATTNLSYARSCNAAISSYSSELDEFRDTATTEWVVTSTETYETTLSRKTSYDCTSYCGSICYADTATTILNVSTRYTTYTTTDWTYLNYTKPAPTCTLGRQDCLGLRSEYDSSYAEYSKAPITEIDGQWTKLVPSPEEPNCCVSTACTIIGAGADIFYFPVTANVSRDYCAWSPTGTWASTLTTSPSRNTDWTPTTTGPYAVYSGTTFYEGNVYLKIINAGAYDNCYNEVGKWPRDPDADILTMASTALYTVRGWNNGGPPFPLNFADFNDPVPWSAYRGQKACSQAVPFCTAVLPNEYHPQLAMPFEYRDLDPAWANCVNLPIPVGLYDPPIALRSVTTPFPQKSSSSSTPAPDPSQLPVTASSSFGGPTPGQSISPSDPPVTSRPPSTPRPTSTNGPAVPSSQSSRNPQSPGNSQGPSQPQLPNTLSRPNNPQPSNNVPVPGNSPVPNDPQGPNNPRPSNNAPGPGDPQTPSNPQGPNNPQGSNRPQPGSNPQNPANPQDPNSPQVTNNPLIPGSPIIIGGTPITLAPSNSLVLNPGLTLTQNGPPITVSGTTISLSPTGISLSSPSGSTSIPLTPGSPATIPLGSETLTLTPPTSDLTFVLQPGTTLSVNGPTATISGTTISLSPTGISLSSPSGTTSIPLIPGTPATIPLGSTTLTLTPSPTTPTLVLQPGTTLSINGPAATISGTTISLSPTGIIVIDPSRSTRTIPFAEASATPLVVGAKTLRFDNAGDLVLGPGTTLSRGVTVVDGTTFSVGTSGVVVVAGGRTVTSVGRSTGTGSGSGRGTATVTGSVVLGTGGAGRVERRLELWWFGGVAAWVWF